jgi:surface antigen
MLYQKFSTMLCAIVLLFPLTACETTTPSSALSALTSGQGIGTLVGAGAGGAIGSRVGQGDGKTLAIAGGALLGGLIGNQLGDYLSQDDKQQLDTTTQETLNTGKPQSFRNPETGISAKTQLVQTASSQAGNCKNVEQTISLKDGSTKQHTVEACKINGVWKISSNA